MAKNFDNLKFQEAQKVENLVPPSHYIIHCYDKCGLYNLKGNGMKKFPIWKIFKFIHVHYGTIMQNYNCGLQEELMVPKWLYFDRNRWNGVNHLWFHVTWCGAKLFSSIFEIFSWKYWKPEISGEKESLYFWTIK